VFHFAFCSLPVWSAIVLRVSRPAGAGGQAVSDFFGRITQNSFPLRVSEDRPRLCAGLPDVDPAGTERKKALKSLIADPQPRW